MAAEDEFEQTPDARAGRALLEAGLARVEPADREAFWEAVRRCYASAADDASEAPRGD